MCTDDSHCIRQCLDGQPEAFRHLVTRYQGSVLSFLAGRLGDRERAEEAAQETFVRAYFALGRLTKPEAVFPWLLGIASRVVQEQFRQQQRQRVAARMWAQSRPQPEMSEGYALERAVADLAEPYRQIVLLRYYGGCSCSQVAERLSMPLGTVTKYLSRAYATLRDTLRENDGQQRSSEVAS
jgi:RNA polymerase sigma factor (sigma-70 family)